MGSFMGGSAPAMARQVVGGYTLLSKANLKRLSTDQLSQLQFELDKALRDTRAEPMDLTDQTSVQVRNRQISRIDGALRMLRANIQERKRRRM